KNVTRCFDLLARKEEKIILIKIITDANSLNHESIDELKHTAGCIDATPLIITEKSGKELEDNVVYSRFGIYTLNKATFRNSLKQKLPFVKSGKAGLTVTIDGDKLRTKREEEKLSLNDISRKIGVSKRMIVNYENSNSDIAVQKAWKLYDLFGRGIFNHIDIFSEMENIVYNCKSQVGKKYSELGFSAVETKRNIFDIIAKKEKEIILTTVGDKFNKELSSLSRLLDAENLLVFERRKPKLDIPTIAKEDFLELKTEKELINIIKK
ncbi:MAG: helix-turn-helix domain-containing protein, partial [Nanoarchaeota archaeon]|nr:helix-turn-helix domain-containing protein [Nanoarchaeota archaeon]